MNKVVKASALVAGVILIGMLIIGVSAVFAQNGDDDSPAENAPLRRGPFRSFIANRAGRVFGLASRDRDLEGVTPRDELLAEALDITLDDLNAARAEAQTNWLAELVEAGYLSQEQVDLMVALQALKGAINRQEIVATALGLEVSEVAAAREEGKRLAELLEEQGLSRLEFKVAIEAAIKEAVLAAVPDFISQEQAELILDRVPEFRCWCARRPQAGHPGHRFQGGRFHGPGQGVFSPGFGPGVR